MRRSKSLLKMLLKRLFQSIGIALEEPLGEQLFSLDRSANTVGLKNWVKKEYR